MNIVKITENSLFLSSGLPQNSFAKTDMEKLLNERSIILHITKDTIISEFYTFDGTRVGENDITLFEGKAFSGEFLSEILEKKDFDAIDLLSLANFGRGVDYILQNQALFEGADFAVGGNGIIINSDSDSSHILFLSARLFDACAQNHRSDYSEIQGKYLYKGLDYDQQLCFLRGTVAYKALTGHYPFENTNTSARQEDIFDGNFIPLALWKPEIEKNLAQAIESSLKAKITQTVMAGKKNITDVKAENKKQSLLKEAKNFAPAVFKAELEKKSEDNALLAQKRQDFTAKMQKYLKVKRFLRRNKSRILVAMAVILFASWGADSMIKQSGKLLTTKGMTSVEATQAYYSMIHRMDVPGLQEVIKGRKTKDLFAKISAYYVASKQRLQVHPDNGTVTPAKWFFYKKASKNWMFGITKLKIDGKDYAADKKYPIRSDKPFPLTEENGRILQEGDEVSHTAEYYLVEQAEKKIYVQKITDVVTLRYTGKRWRVVGADGKANVSDVKATDFAKEFYELTGKDIETQEDMLQPKVEPEQDLREQSASKIREAIEILRQKYDWIPDEEDMTFAAEFLFNEYGSIEAEKYLRR